MPTIIINLPTKNLSKQKNLTQEFIDFMPQSEAEEIIQNVKTICSTPKNSVPLDREFGINTDFIDAPTPAVIAQIQREIIQAVKKYEPRCKVEYVEFTINDNANLTAQVRITINDNDS